MKLNWPRWALITVWFAAHLVGFVSLALGWLIPIGFFGGILIYAVYGAFAQGVVYGDGILLGKKTYEKWKAQTKDTRGPSQPNAQTSRQKAWGFLIWILLPLIVYIPFFIIAIQEK